MSESDYDDGDPYACIARGADLELYHARQRARQFQEQVAECFYSGDADLERLLEQDRTAVIESLESLFEEEPWKHPRRRHWAALKLHDLGRRSPLQLWKSQAPDDEHTAEPKPRGLIARLKGLFGL